MNATRGSGGRWLFLQTTDDALLGEDLAYHDVERVETMAYPAPTRRA